MTTGQESVVAEEARTARAEELRGWGFVHVTGLPTWNLFGRPNYVIQAHQSELGCWSHNNGKVVVVTPDGEVWLGIWGGHSCPLSKFCPNGIGAFVPCSNGEQIPMLLLLTRVKDPYSNCQGDYSPIPCPRD